ncbi:Uncharacterised protein [Mycoplasmopsis maculosa]|uniref:Uncharacterized protein n=1 Tax=Mycoplasmopsis maculosa TaxID=114885 RepID=A0A449B5C0_9BACT|nr:hypothetical protein [Mycoplasmopsis maculosa]VEU75765.1 Uncharacterised protein [Mycoplasmopsis maculosa]
MKKPLKALKIKYLWFWIMGVILGLFIPFSLVDLIAKWNKFDLTQIILVITFTFAISIFFIFSLIYLILQIRIISKKRKLDKALKSLKKDEQLNKNEIKKIEIELNTINENYYKK